MREDSKAWDGLRRQEMVARDNARAEARRKLLSYPASLKDGPRPQDGPAPSYRAFPILRKKSTGFRSLIERHNLVKMNMEMLAREQADLRGQIQLFVELAGQKSVMMDAILVTRTEGRKPSEKIDRKRISKQLMKRGFTADDAAVIVNSSIVKGKPGKPGIVITDTSKPRGKKGAVAEEE